MKCVALGLAAAIAAAALTTATPAAAGVYVEFRSGPSHYYRPPPPRVYHRPVTRVYYAPAPRPRTVCRVTIARDWGRSGPVTRRVETCRERW